MNMNAESLRLERERPQLKGFDEFFQSRIAPWIDSQKQRQQDIDRWATKCYVVGAIAYAVIYVFFGLLLGIEFTLDFISLYVVLVVGIGNFPRILMHREVRDFLVQSVCEFFGFQYVMRPDPDSLTPFEGSGLLVSHDSARLEDGISGVHDGVSFRLFECTFQRGEKKKTVGRALLLNFSFPKNFRGVTLVKKDLGAVVKFLDKPLQGGSKVALEDPRFEQLFEVYGSDQIEARYLLTPAFMERMVALAALFGQSRPEFCFRENQLLIAVPTKSNLFEAGHAKQSVTDTRRIETLVRELCVVFDIIDELNLRTTSRV